jgi:NAD(P)H-dependent FMN reductase
VNFAVVSGSQRVGSQSRQVANWIAGLIGEASPEDVAECLDLAEAPLPLWDEGDRTGGTPWSDILGSTCGRMRRAAAIVLVTPEWGGMATPALKNFLLLCTPDEVGHKPALIVTVSSSQGGTYPVAELRMNSGKNNRILYIPDSVIVRNVDRALDPKSPEFARVGGRLRHALGILRAYGRALAPMRASTDFDYESYPYGM